METHATTQPSTALADARKYSYRYHAAAPWALRALDLRLDAGAWLVLSGAAGSGKSTLARALNGTVPHFFGGEASGSLHVCGLDPAVEPMSVTFRQVSALFQDPAAQLLGATVARELAFGLESLGLARSAIAARVAASAVALGIGPLLGRAPERLSGGQQQLILIAAFLALAPHLLVLDEPLAHLDAGARQRVLDGLRRVHAQGVGLVLVDHLLDPYVDDATLFALLAEGVLVGGGDAAWATEMALRHPALGVAPPAAARWWAARVAPVLAASTNSTAGYAGARPYSLHAVEDALTCLPLSVRRALAQAIPAAPVLGPSGAATPAAEWLGVSYSYPAVAPFGGAAVGAPAPAVRDISCAVGAGEALALLGPNGAGKSTLLRMLNGLIRPTHGLIRVCGVPVGKRPTAELARLVGYAPQRPERLFFRATVAEELAVAPRALGIERTSHAWLDAIIQALGIDPLLPQSPYSLSAGQQRLVAIAAALAARPRVVALDEPSAGLDSPSRIALTRLLALLAAEGTAVVLATHDIALAEVADRWLVLRDGTPVASGAPGALMADTARLATADIVPSVAARLDALARRMAWGNDATAPRATSAREGI